MKDEKGLTYVATIILVIIIIAFAIGVILYIQQQYRNEESETIKTNMLAIQGKAKMVAEEEKALKKELIGTKILIEQQDQKVKDFLKSQNIEIPTNQTTTETSTSSNEQEETKNLPSSTTTVDNNEIQDSKTETTQ